MTTCSDVGYFVPSICISVSNFRLIWYILKNLISAVCKKKKKKIDGNKKKHSPCRACLCGNWIGSLEMGDLSTTP
jgi:hypothetical protein